MNELRDESLRASAASCAAAEESPLPSTPAGARGPNGSCLASDRYLSPLRLLKQSRLIGPTCLSDANPNKSAAVGGHSLRCLRVLAQTCLMSRSTDIYSAAVGLICIKRERTAAATCSAHTACGPEHAQAGFEHRPSDVSANIFQRKSSKEFRIFTLEAFLNWSGLIFNFVQS